ncbi:hypothetical protein HNP55_004521 [Paucibacter oligotrophus]|uniref:Uncharacterized protein n=1 Tax=Roseateles oligotrophus TaxID=1769250 RepID=A0A840LKZ3_9BURK|nr:hypothetical protein [Roseateles oligotrophus]MBB4845967.1 hypothetical protein [Roseateles oligotrophus]
MRLISACSHHLRFSPWPVTVKHHLKAIFAKLTAHRRARRP